MQSLVKNGLHSGKRTNDLHISQTRNTVVFMSKTSATLGVFRTDCGITLSFGSNTYFIESNDPFLNIANKALERNDFVPLYVEIAKREGVGPEFRDMLLGMIEQSESGDLNLDS
mgnify:FL=1